jgi:CBS domain-containing protein
MSVHTVCATPGMKLGRVARLMLENDCGAIPIVENLDAPRPTGIITDRDITCRVVAHGLNPLQIRVGDVMTSPVITVLPDATIEECIELMEQNQLRRMVVVDEAGDLCGMVAQGDIAQIGPPEETAELLQDISISARLMAGSRT